MNAEKEREKVKVEIRKKLQKLRMKQNEADDLIAEIEGKVDEINGVAHPIKTGYGTSCLRLTNTKGRLITEY